MPDELWTEVRDIVQETGIKTIPKKKKCKKAKWLSEEALQIAVTRSKVKSTGEKERYTHVNAVNTKGQFSVHRSEKTPGSKYSSTSGLSPRGHLERQAELYASTQDEA